VYVLISSQQKQNGRKRAAKQKETHTTKNLNKRSSSNRQRRRRRRQRRRKTMKKCTSKTELFPTAYDFAGQHWWLKRGKETAREGEKGSAWAKSERAEVKRCKRINARWRRAVHAAILKDRQKREREREAPSYNSLAQSERELKR